MDENNAKKIVHLKNITRLHLILGNRSVYGDFEETKFKEICIYIYWKTNEKEREREFFPRRCVD